MKKVISIKTLSLLLMFFVTTASFAVQDNPTEPPEEEDAQVAPIDDYIVPMLLAGAVLGYVLLNRKTKQA